MRTDKELSAYVKSLKETEKKDFYTLLTEVAFCNPYEHYNLYYPLALELIEPTK